MLVCQFCRRHAGTWNFQLLGESQADSTTEDDQQVPDEPHANDQQVPGEEPQAKRFKVLLIDLFVSGKCEDKIQSHKISNQKYFSVGNTNYYTCFWFVHLFVVNCRVENFRIFCAQVPKIFSGESRITQIHFVY